MKLLLLRLIPSLVLGILVTGFVENVNAGLLGSTFSVTKGGSGYSDPSFQYGIEDALRGIQTGVTTFESIGGNGQNLFVYFLDNVNNPNNKLSDINGGTDSWTASGLAAFFPPGGLTTAPIIRVLAVGERGSTTYGALTATAPDGGIFIQSWNAGSFTLGIQSSAQIANGAKVGYEITLGQVAAVPEPSSLVVGIGLAGFVLLRRRRKSAEQNVTGL
jgi:hypothetical protein